MTSPATSTHPLRALAALLAMAAAMHGLRAEAGEPAAPDSDATAHVHVVGHRLALHTACPFAESDLPDDLAQAAVDHGAAATVPVEFKLQGDHVFDVQAASDSPRLTHQVRRAIRGLSCDSDDDAVHTVAVVLRFLDPASARAVADTRVAIEDSAGELTDAGVGHHATP